MGKLEGSDNETATGKHIAIEVKQIWRSRGSKRGNVWRAVIYKNNQQIYLGSFADIEAARDAYKKAAIEQFGEFYAP